MQFFLVLLLGVFLSNQAHADTVRAVVCTEEFDTKKFWHWMRNPRSDWIEMQVRNHPGCSIYWLPLEGLVLVDQWWYENHAIMLFALSGLDGRFAITTWRNPTEQSTDPTY